jgi:hypothetical protein
MIVGAFRQKRLGISFLDILSGKERSGYLKANHVLINQD